MKLSKEQALILVKMLSLLASNYEVSEDVQELALDLEDFVLNGDSDEDACEETECCDHDEEDSDDEGEEDEVEDEDDSDEEDKEESDEEEDEEDDQEELVADDSVSADVLHDLKSAKAAIMSSMLGGSGDEVSLEFEDLSTDYETKCDLLVDGAPSGNVVVLRRQSDQLHVAVGEANDYTWHRFAVSRFPKGWAQALPLDALVEIQ